MKSIMEIPRLNMKIAISDREGYCKGASLVGPSQHYVAVVGVACAQASRELTEKLDRINAYDKVEAKLKIGQVNGD